jgi:peptide/nickel transport system substrate-binding protein
MKKKLLWALLCCSMVAAMVLASCGTASTTTTSTTSPATSTGQITQVAPGTTQAAPTTSATATKWWTKFGTPQYGNSITVRTTYLRNEFGNNNWLGWGTRLQFENLFVYDWTVDPSVWDFSVVFVPWTYDTGLLVKSWETPDAQTWVLHLQQGVHFANMPPVNGREFTSADVVAHYNRLLGTGGGYTAGLPMMATQAAALKGSTITAPDKYTVQIKFATPAAINVYTLANETGVNQMEAPETVTPTAPLPADPKQSIGTGPWVLTDFTAESSATFSKNTNYWRYDPRYPKNLLPYADKVMLLSIPDLSTAMAAIRTGKIDYLDGLFPDQANQILKTNPELLNSKQVNAGPSIEPRNDLKPFSDIRVREAMQLSLDLPAIDKAFYANEVPPYSCGPINNAYTGFMTPYANWPQSLKDEYTYNPTKAKQLLSDAGFPNGFDTTIQADASQGMDLLQALNGYFKAVGINATIQPMDTGTLSDVIAAGKHVIRFDYGGRTGANTTPWQALGQRLSGAVSNENRSSDPKFDAMYNTIIADPDYADAVKTCIAADQYALTQHWGIFTFPIYKHTVYQPYLKGYNGQYTGASGGRHPGAFYSMLWIDSALKAKTRQ